MTQQATLSVGPDVLYIPPAHEWLGYLEQIRALDPASTDRALVSLRLDIERYGVSGVLVCKWKAYHGDMAGFGEDASSPAEAIAKLKTRKQSLESELAALRLRASEVEAKLQSLPPEEPAS